MRRSSPPDTPRLRLFVPDDLAAGATIAASAEQAHYLAHVMRERVGARIALFNGRDGEWAAEITALGTRGAELRVCVRLRAQAPEPDLWLVPATLKREAFELVVEKATELGVAAIHPVVSERSVVPRLNRTRLAAIAREAAEQSRRLSVPSVAEALPLADFLRGLRPGRALILADETGAGAPIARVAAGLVQGAPHAILIGPEGGFSPHELDRLRGSPFVVSVDLGPRILRAETAAIAALACFQALCGDWRSD
ncbi:MAG: 16S rRNA (uracil(1498)-N(3))-methyltransferase [Alphaproteobacteria bacterium]|nr:16S rRNA (uracil(1498)-N(3))-methyltransferase [Alphaproteobacteria bacterium]